MNANNSNNEPTTEFKPLSPTELVDLIKKDPKGFDIEKESSCLLLKTISACKDTNEFNNLFRLIEEVGFRYSTETTIARDRFDSFRNRFSINPEKLTPNFIRGEENRLVVMTGNHLKGAWGLLKLEPENSRRFKMPGDKRTFFLLQLHKENKALKIGKKQGAKIIGENPIEIYSALAGYLHEDRHNPFKTIDAVNAMPDIREKIGLIVNDPRMTEGEIINVITPFVLKAL